MNIIIYLYGYQDMFVQILNHVSLDIIMCFFMDSTICLYSMEITVCLFVYNSMLLTNTLHKVIKVIL